MRGQAAPIYWIVLMVIMFGIWMMVTYLSPMIETVSSLGKNLTADLPLNASVAITIDRWNNAYNIVPLVLLIGALFAIIIVAKKRDFDPSEVGL